jgi:choline dehydrogenase-like flavoprotein
MIRQLDGSADGSQLAADVCVIGAGAAGITLALELARMSRSVVVLEAGLRDFDGRSQECYAGTNVGREYFDLRATRLRMLGGTTNHWSGWCTPMRRIDMETRPWMGCPGWPITWDELQRWYPRAQELCQLEKFDYDATHWFEPHHHLLPLDGERLQHLLIQHSPPTRFGDVYAQDLEKAPRTDLLLDATLVGITLAPGSNRVLEAVARSRTGATVRVKAQHYVVACGGIENARLLLAFSRSWPDTIRRGLDNVGRYFCDHIESIAGHLHIPRRADRRWVVSYMKTRFAGVGSRMTAALTLPDKLQRDLELNDVEFFIVPLQDQRSGYLAARRLLLTLVGRAPDDANLMVDVPSAIGDLDEIALYVHHRLRGTNYEYPITSDPIELRSNLEPTPQRDSRVRLVEATDEFGIPRLQLDWRVGPDDKPRLAKAAKLAAAELMRLTTARVRLPDWLSGEGEIPVEGAGHHHTGTTRMASSATDGVVDANCRVFGVDNLYAAGSSVFTSAGYANPTLTIVALAARLADHLNRRLPA